ncbi:MAG: SDR family oxidoreductase [Pseudomonadales bacterium]|nr:SDR family oxidoreductase [Pseudomonadales bacterium]
MDLQLSGKRAIITGATKGIGKAIAQTLAQEGVDIALCARNLDEVETTIAGLKQLGINAYGEVVDIQNKQAYESWLAKSVEQLGGIDLFVPNVSAGGGMDGEENWQRCFEIDMLGTVRGCEILLPLMKDGGAICLISSTAAVENFIAPQAYNSIKAGLINYAKHLSQLHAPRKIRVNTVSPGPVFIEEGAWDQIKEHMPELYDTTVGQIPMGRMASAEEIANGVAFLLSPAAGFITGANLRIDGGFTKGIQY